MSIADEAYDREIWFQFKEIKEYIISYGNISDFVWLIGTYKFVLKSKILNLISQNKILMKLFKIYYLYIIKRM